MDKQNLIILLFISGIVCLLLEILLPGAIVGTIGTILLLIGTYFAAEIWGLGWALGAFLGSIGFCGLLFYLFFRSPLRGLFINESSIGSDLPTHGDLRVGLSGVTLTPLRPSGKVAFSIAGRERPWDVVTDGNFIEKDQSVKILRIEGSRVIVGTVSPH